jgi:hypothetical protein
LVIWEDVPVEIYRKCWHVHKVNGILHRDFTKDYGDIPVARFNSITKKWEQCINPRGNAYAKRNDIKYRKKRKYESTI